MKITTILLTALLFACSCGETKKMKSKEIEPVLQKAEIGPTPRVENETSILSAEVNGNTLLLEVSYSGGCEEQTFELIGDGMIMKSLPPKRGITLIRDSKGDSCRKLVKKSLKFDLSDLAYKKEAGSQIVLRLNGYKEEILYTYMQAKGVE